ncbi:hypothetical protein HPP92_018332 [Vanilla planifolia]|uniref:Uncharacterized protein n=1 Tax=Vanilla planifolia TaxID=51239 RepID=A0A835QFD8_VANPL|nr:hypothetical protein HPP92_018332 [Vanilla planifolia]
MWKLMKSMHTLTEAIYNSLIIDAFGVGASAGRLWLNQGFASSFRGLQRGNSHGLLVEAIKNLYPKGYLKKEYLVHALWGVLKDCCSVCLIELSALLLMAIRPLLYLNLFFNQRYLETNKTLLATIALHLACRNWNKKALGKPFHPYNSWGVY